MEHRLPDHGDLEPAGGQAPLTANSGSIVDRNLVSQKIRQAMLGLSQQQLIDAVPEGQRVVAVHLDRQIVVAFGRTEPELLQQLRESQISTDEVLIRPLTNPRQEGLLRPLPGDENL